MPPPPSASSALSSRFASWTVGLAVRSAGNFAETLTNPLTREGYYSANWSFSNVVPSIDVCSSVYYAGRITHSEFYDLMGWNGAEWKGWMRDASLAAVPKAWKHAVEIAHPRLALSDYKQLWDTAWIHDDVLMARAAVDGITLPTDMHLLKQHFHVGTIDDWRKYWLQGRADDELYRGFIRHNAIHDDRFHANALRDKSPVGVGQARARYTVGLIDDARLQEEFNLAGFGRPGDFERADGFADPPSVEETMRLWWRGDIDRNGFRRFLRYNGRQTDRQIEDTERALRPLPSPSDLIRFAVREAWDPAVVDRFGYDAEYPAELRHWLKAQGLLWTGQIAGPGGTVIREIDWGKYYWRSHWQVISPSMAYDMFHRLRPERIARYARDWPNLRPFTRDDLDTVLKINDYPPAVRDWLGAVGMRRLDARGLRSMFIRNVRPRAWVRQQLLDWGYTEEDADAKLEQWWADFQWSENSHVRSRYKRAETDVIAITLDSYANGLIDDDRCRALLEGFAIPPEYITSMMQVENSRKAVRYIKDVIKQLRRDFMMGATNLDEVGTLLIRAGVVGAERTRLLQEWILRKSMSRRIQSAAWVIGMVKRGLLSVPNAQTRLANLGWLAPDIALATASILQDTAKAQAKIATSAGKQRLAGQKQLVSARKQAIRAAKSAQAELRRLYPKADLKKWLQRGWRSEAWVTARLREQGYPDDFIRLTIAEWQSAATNPPAKKGAKATNGETGGTGGGGTG